MIIILLTLLILLWFIFIIIYRNEYQIKKNSTPSGKIEEYWQGRERRQAVRLEIPLEVKYTCAPTNNHTHVSITKNVSGSGVQLLIYEKLNLGDTIDVELSLNDKEHLFLTKGQIVWLQDATCKANQQEEKRSFLVGVKFIDLKPSEEKRLSRFIYNKCQAIASP